MVPSRPLLYLSIPGVAFILGVFWFRRRNKSRVEKDDKESNDKEDIQNKELPVINEISRHNSLPTTVTKSMNINGVSTSYEEDNTASKLFGKSAPIQIVQNGKCSPIKVLQQTQLDSEALKSKIQDASNKVLRSIDEDFENLSSPVDLPDSVGNRISFYSRTVNSNKDQPVVIKATITPKISPENSFLESKYTSNGEQNNNFKTLDDILEPKSNSKQLNNEVIEEVEKKQLQPVQEQPKKQQNVTEIKSQEIALEENQDIEMDMDNKKDEENVENTNDVDSSGKRDIDAASPSLSMCSIHSNDSGKGSSLPRSEVNRGKIVYEFLFPNSLVCHLYGRKRAFVNQIKAKTSANVLLRKNDINSKLRICAIEGSENDVNAALAMIRQRLPAKRYPHFTMQRIHFAQPHTIVRLSPESLVNLQLQLIEGINNDVLVSTVVTGGQIFVQHPLHPSHPSLAILQKCLYDSYTTSEAPLLPGIEIGAVCVMPVNGIWYRVQIVGTDPEDKDRCVVKFLDFGGYMNVYFNELRQIRSDYMGLPFQATECVLSNIQPIGEYWSPEAADILSKLTKGIVLQAQVAGYNSDSVPEIYLFAYLGPNNVIFINKELVARNLAKWVEVRD